MAKFADDRASLAGPEQTRDDSRGDGADVRIPVGLRGPRQAVGARSRTVGRRQLYTTLSKLPMLYFPAHDVSLNHAQGRDTAPGPSLRPGEDPRSDLYVYARCCFDCGDLKPHRCPPSADRIRGRIRDCEWQLGQGRRRRRVCKGI